MDPKDETATPAAEDQPDAPAADAPAAEAPTPEVDEQARLRAVSDRLRREREEAGKRREQEQRRRR